MYTTVDAGFSFGIQEGLQVLPVAYLCHHHGCTLPEPCPTHTRKNSYQRGYGGKRWKALRLFRFHLHPLCHGKWSLCEKAGRITPSTDLDHDQRPPCGPDDERWWAGLWNELCGPCHMTKTREEQQWQ